jgi:hypothetical protein
VIEDAAFGMIIRGLLAMAGGGDFREDVFEQGAVTEED